LPAAQPLAGEAPQAAEPGLVETKALDMATVKVEMNAAVQSSAVVSGQPQPAESAEAKTLLSRQQTETLQ
jgi:hypothetical protein